jgi:hypothetical protein
MTVSRHAAARFALACAIFAASLWDFRIATVRIFDLISLISMCGFFLLEFDARRDWLSKRIYVLPLTVLIVAYAGLGYANFHHRSSLAIALLALVSLQFAGYSKASWLAGIFRGVVYLNVTVLLVQYFSFHIFGHVLDPQQLLGERSRILLGTWSTPYLRPAGLFQEPNSYALNLFMMTVAALVPKRDRILALIAAGSMLLSESMWAVVAAFVLVALNEWNSDAAFVKRSASVLLLWLAMFVCFNGYLWLLKPEQLKEPPLYSRLSHMQIDASARDRYGALLDRAAATSCPACQLNLETFHIPKSLGRGLSTAAFISAVPANGFSFVWYCMGPAGLGLLAIALFSSLYGAIMRDALYAAAALVFVFTTYPTVTYVIFWLWFAAIITMVRQRPRNSAGDGFRVPHAGKRP